MPEFTSPANTILIGLTNDVNLYTLAFYFQDADDTSASALRYGGHYSMLYVDGHAKSIKMSRYSFPADGDAFDIMPMSVNDIKSYCYDVEAIQERNAGYGNGYPCSTVAQMLNDNRVIFN